MAKTSWYAKQVAADAARKADMAARFAAMTERELVAELTEIENDDRAMRLDRTANQSGWERLAMRSELVRAELAARRAADLDQVDAPTDEEMVAMDFEYRQMLAQGADEVAHFRAEVARIDQRDAGFAAVNGSSEPF